MSVKTWLSIRDYYSRPRMWRAVFLDPELQAEYEESRSRGSSHDLAMMFVTQTPPGLQTDTRFLHGKQDNGFYSHQLQSWVSSRADVKRICAEKNYHCDGAVSHVAGDRTVEKPYKVADDIVHDAVLDVLEEHPTALKDDPQLIDKTRTRLTGDQ